MTDRLQKQLLTLIRREMEPFDQAIRLLDILGLLAIVIAFFGLAFQIFLSLQHDPIALGPIQTGMLLLRSGLIVLLLQRLISFLLKAWSKKIVRQAREDSEALLNGIRRLQQPPNGFTPR
ncbi:MAG: DUF2975 domain-containing protein [Acidobacteria bacterium]|nr:DUF2975 domain-containing protein [Acidobacteriota bacterium]